MADREENESGKASIKIVDRRRFDSSGDEKAEDPTAKAGITNVALAAAAEPEVSSSQQADSDNKDNHSYLEANMNKAQDTVGEVAGGEVAGEDNQAHPEGSEGDISFSSFVLSLATQALMQLGQLSPPDGMPIQVDPIAAKQSIDILSMLDVKTKGNLDPREANLLKDALHNLRVAYLRFR